MKYKLGNFQVGKIIEFEADTESNAVFRAQVEMELRGWSKEFCVLKPFPKEDEDGVKS